MVPIDVHEVRKGMFSAENLSAFFNRVGNDEIMMFTRQFSTLFRAGVSMETIFATLAKQVKSISLRNALTRIRSDISSGSSLAQAFSRHPRIFNDLYVSMLAAGEEAGILEEVLRNLSSLLERDYEIQKNIKGAMLYPKIVIFVLLGAIFFLMTFVVPKFTDFYGRYGAELPLPTQILIWASHFVMHYWYLGIAIIIFCVYLIRRILSTQVGRMKFDRLRFHLPVFGDLNMKVANARFGRILAALYRAGLSMPRALEVVANVIGNISFAQEVRKVRDDIQKGSMLSEAMAKQTYFPFVMVETTAVGEKSGAIDEMLSTIADHYELEVSYTIKNLTALLEPLLLIGIFGIVTLLALAIFLPIWNLSTVIGK
ncbi:MAG: type II secretion system F family protein, partial [Deltaproteobacteria bacterium]|nr:type II secretion system F family protein [Deltaproteobacteria bacterium]